MKISQNKKEYLKWIENVMNKNNAAAKQNLKKILNKKLAESILKISKTTDLI